MQYDKTITTRHLNGSKLYLNKRGAKILSSTFIESISDTVYRQSILHNPDNCLMDEYKARVGQI